MWSYDTIVDGPGAQFHGGMLVRDDLLVVGTDATEGGRVYAFDGRTGDVRWTFDAGPGVASDILSNAEHAFASTLDGRLLCLAPETGALVWSHQEYEIDERVWGPGGLSPALEGSDLYWATLSRRLLCVDPATGEIRWRCRLRTSATTTPLVTADWVLVGTEDGLLVRIDRGSGEVLGEFALPGTPYGNFVSAERSILVFMDWMWNTSELVALTPSADGIRWQRSPPDTTSWTSPRPLVSEGVVLAGNQRGDVLALDLEDGTPRHLANLGSVIRAFREAEGRLYVGTVGGTLVSWRSGLSE